MRRIAEALSRLMHRLRGLAYRVLDTVPPVRRTVDEVLRVELVDRAMVIAAQALLALVPLVVVLVAFVPKEITDAAVERFEDVTGLAAARQDLLSVVGPSSEKATAVTSSAGVVGVIVTIVSATSFARAVMRAYERVWNLPRISGLSGRWRSTWWLLGWLAGLAIVAFARESTRQVGGPLLAPATLALQAGLMSAVWWWSMYVLLSGRVPWRELVIPAVLTGVTVVLYAAGSTVVMPVYAASSVDQFGGFGLVLAVATWLIGVAAVLVASALVGRVIAEDPWTKSVAADVARAGARFIPTLPGGGRARQRTRSPRGR